MAEQLGFSSTLRYISGNLANCNEAQPQSVYNLFQAENRPSSMTTHLLITVGDQTMKLQLASDNTKNVYYRTMFNEKWTEWAQM